MPGPSGRSIRRAPHFATTRPFPLSWWRNVCLAGSPPMEFVVRARRHGSAWRSVWPTLPGVTGGATPYDAHKPNGQTMRAGGFGGGSRHTIGWQPTCRCACNEVLATAIVFDPFVGTGTTLQVARQHGRDGIGTDLSWTYSTRSAGPLRPAALAAWQHGEAPHAERVDDLPLFALAQDGRPSHA